MMQEPLLIASILRHADRCHGDTEIVSRLPEGGLHRTTYRETHARCRRLARALQALGIAPPDRVATLAWNTHRHFELYYAAAGLGAVVHTINPRLSLEQLAYIINHAEDRLVCCDRSFLPLAAELAPLCPGVRGWIALTDRAHLPDGPQPLHAYEELLAAQDDGFEWPELDEQAAAGLCYTSGTTGHPKGVLYSHRATVLHAYAISLPDSFGLSARDTVLTVVPMFHVNAWGLPFAAPLVGAKLVLPGAALDGASLVGLCQTEGVTCSGGVPTVWRGILDHLERSGARLPLPHRTIIGGAAASETLIRTLQEGHGVEVRHSWGMTEMSPAGTINTPKRPPGPAHPHPLARQAKQGRALPGIALRLVDAAGRPLPHDGRAAGELQVRGPWVCRDYFKGEGGSPLRDGWFPTGDVATIDPDGYLQIVDRIKDLVKSGGEWISSLELENLLAAHPAVQEAAVIGVPHEKWGERPLVVAVLRPGHAATAEQLLAALRDRVPRWAVPDAVVFLPALPRTGTGKVTKARLREDYRDFFRAAPG